MPKSPVAIVLLAALAAPAGAVQSLGWNTGSLAMSDPAAAKGFNDIGPVATTIPAAGAPIARNLPADFNFIAGAAPEPGAWALMIAGFGLVGWTARRRRLLAVTAS